MIVLFLLLCLYCPFADAAGRYFSRKEVLRTEHADWMRWLPDELNLSQISMPGTHDTMADKYGGNIQTQSLSLKKQLEAGVRVIDIRARHVSDTFEIYHGICNLGYSFGPDVLSVCVDFLREHPFETIIMKLGESGVPGAYNTSREYWETFMSYREDPAYSSYFWQKPSDWPPPPNLGEVRGKIILIQKFSSPNPIGFSDFDLAFFPFGLWNVPTLFHIKSNWKKKREFLEAVNVRVFGNRCNITSLSGNSALAHPNHIAGGFLCFFRGINDYALEYIFRGDHEYLGTLMMDFPGEGLINALIAMNMKHATSSSAIADDFSDMWNNICYSATGKPYNNGEGRVVQLTSYLKNILPSEKWALIVTKSDWGADIVHSGLFATSKPIEGYSHLAFTRNNPVSLPSGFAEAVEEMEKTVSGKAQKRAERLAQLIRDQFPEYEWSVFVKKAPGGGANWAFTLKGPYYKEWKDGFAYVVWAENKVD